MKSLFLSLIVLLSGWQLQAQVMTNGTAVGFPENGLFTGSSIESVQVNNGNLHVEIPIYALPGRGVSSRGAFVYNSKGWYPYSTCTNLDCVYSIEAEPYNTMTMAMDKGGYNFTLSQMHKQICDVAPPYYTLQSNLIIIESDGTKHHMVPDPINIQAVSNNCWATGGSNQYADDGSGWYYGANGAASKSGGVPGEFDSNGNSIGATDTLGRTITAGAMTYYDSQGVERAASVTSESLSLGTHLCTNITGYCSEYTSEYEGTWSVPHIITLPNGLTYTIEYIQNAEAEISSITLPTGAQIQYTYTPQPVGTDNSGLRVASRSVTVGSTTSTWTYTYTVTSPGVVVTTVTDPLNNYVKYTCTAMAELSYFNDLSDSPSLADPSCEITKEQYYDSLGTLIKTVDKTYQDPPRLLASETTIWNTTNQVSQVQYTHESLTISMFPEGYWGPVSAPISWGNISQKREYDWGTGAPGSLLRTTDYTYLHTDTTVNPNSNRALYLAANIADRPTSEIVKDASGNIVAQTKYYYDEGTLTPTTNAVGHNYTYYPATNTIRGNLTRVSRWSNSTGQWLDTTYSYDDLGNRRSVTDPKGHTTTYDYTDRFSGANCNSTSQPTFALPTTVTDALGHRVQTTYYQCSGLAQNAKDENDLQFGNPGSTYTYDLLNRVLTTTHSDGGTISTSYQDSIPLQATTTTAITGASVPTGITPSLSHSTTAIADGLGRVVKTQMSDPEGTDYVDTTYDLLSRTYTVSTPYRSLSDITYGLTTSLYDNLGRKTSETDSDNVSTQSWNYSGNTVTYTNENNSQWARTSDALGRLTKVMEPSGSAQGPTLETDYAYDALGNLTCAVQKATDTTGFTTCAAAPAAWRHRSFSYDSLSRLLTAYNPETGTITYAYTKTDGTLCAGDLSLPCSKTDARNVTTYYAYDALNRLLSKSYSDASTPWSCYQYDASSVTNGIGRLSNAWTQSASAPSCAATAPSSGFWTKRSILAYDPMGRLLREQQYTPYNRTSGAPYAPQYAYDFVGDLLTSTDGTTPSPTTSGAMLTFTFAPDSVGRLQTVTSNWNDGSGGTHPPTLFTAQTSTGTQPCANSNSAAYEPFGGLMNATFGNGLALNRAYDNRLRTSCEIDTGTGVGVATHASETVAITGAEQSK